MTHSCTEPQVRRSVPLSINVFVSQGNVLPSEITLCRHTYVCMYVFIYLLFCLSTTVSPLSSSFIPSPHLLYIPASTPPPSPFRRCKTSHGSHQIMAYHQEAGSISSPLHQGWARQPITGNRFQRASSCIKASPKYQIML